MSGERGDQRVAPREPGRWAAGQVEPCGGGTDHEVVAVHVIVRCGCGYACMSTDGAIALNLAQRHRPSGGET